MNHMPQLRPSLAGTERGLSGGRRPLVRVPAGWFPLLQWFLQGEKSRGIWVCTLVRGQLKGFPLSAAILPHAEGQHVPAWKAGRSHI